MQKQMAHLAKESRSAGCHTANPGTSAPPLLEEQLLLTLAEHLPGFPGPSSSIPLSLCRLHDSLMGQGGQSFSPFCRHETESQVSSISAPRQRRLSSGTPRANPAPLSFPTTGAFNATWPLAEQEELQIIVGENSSDTLRI